MYIRNIFQKSVSNGFYDLRIFCLVTLRILLLSLLKLLDFVLLFMELVNLKQFICWKNLCLKIADICKMHIKEFSIKNRFYKYHFDNLLKTKKKNKKLEAKNILVDEKNYMYAVVCFTRFVHSKSIKMSSLHYHELLRKAEENEEKKHLMGDEYMLLNLSHKIKETIFIEKIDDTKKVVEIVCYRMIPL